jgi:hypothetical protein
VVMGYISFKTCLVESVVLLTVLLSVDEDGDSSRRLLPAALLCGGIGCDIAIMLSTTSFILGRFNGSRTQQR